jgi:hypothetical protein
MSVIELSAVPAFYHRYIQRVDQTSIPEALRHAHGELQQTLAGLSEAQWEYRYAAGKWSVKELVQHMIDTDRIFAYRALCIARGETASLPGFEENLYAENSEADRRTPAELLEELRTLHRSCLQLFASFSPTQLHRSGIANENPITCQAIGFIMAGHILHHLAVLQERYLNA